MNRLAADLRRAVQRTGRSAAGHAPPTAAGASCQAATFSAIAMVKKSSMAFSACFSSRLPASSI